MLILIEIHSLDTSSPNILELGNYKQITTLEWTVPLLGNYQQLITLNTASNSLHSNPQGP